MDAKLKDKFIENWGRYFPGTDLPFALFYSEDERFWNDLRPQEGFGCMIAHFSPVLKGQRVAFAKETIACPGAQLTSAQLSTYFVGYQEHVEMRRAVEMAWGGEFTLRRYHDQALSYGSPPVKYVRALILGEEIPEKK